MNTNVVFRAHFNAFYRCDGFNMSTAFFSFFYFLRKPGLHHHCLAPSDYINNALSPHASRPYPCSQSFFCCNVPRPLALVSYSFPFATCNTTLLSTADVMLRASITDRSHWYLVLYVLLMRMYRSSGGCAVFYENENQE